MECISAGKSYLYYIFNEIAYHDFIDDILEYTMLPNLTFVIKISNQMMDVHSYI